MSHNGFGFGGLPSFSTDDDPSSDPWPGFNAAGRASGAHSWTLSEDGLIAFNKDRQGDVPSYTTSQPAESHTYGSESTQYASSPASETEQPYYPMPPPHSPQGQVMMRSTPATHWSGEQPVTTAAEHRPPAQSSSPVSGLATTTGFSSLSPLVSTPDSGNHTTDEAREKAGNRLTDDMARVPLLQRTQKGNKKTTVCGVPVPKVTEPTAVSRDSVNGALKCPICNHRSAEVSQLRKHFPKCVSKHGNPRGLDWDHDSSCDFDGIVLARMGHAAAKRESRERIESKRA